MKKKKADQLSGGISWKRNESWTGSAGFQDLDDGVVDIVHVRVIESALNQVLPVLFDLREFHTHLRGVQCGSFKVNAHGGIPSVTVWGHARYGI